ncbi:Lcl C-terminal domain-containing protein [Polyangium jinanense]|uniref:DUF1566 domain-containing protein n=1 Tax=Polyangium jinanense TaxID=2829994 RepID=A0A9X3X2U6_9BACT|nr:DUF1566 domain-containing protein [Polyangium jinanense]MDC3955047.1 DUF1566 domain-containing protein [Polyangium jinanense]MDC3981183.1 DUF1566 domain-containing protein [Polyangium jinanense]
MSTKRTVVPPFARYVAWQLLLASPLGCEIVAGIEPRRLAPAAAPESVCTEITGAGFPDSATRFCSDGAFAVSCDDTSLGAGQDGHVLGVLPSYTEASFGEVEDGGVRDEILDLVWESDAAPAPVSWEEARARCEKLGGGARLPSRVELVSLVDYGRDGPAINPSMISVPTSSTDLYWTATTAMDGVWVVGFVDGSMTSLDRTLTARTRCVIGPPRALCFEEGADGETLIDERTGLVWQRVSTPEVSSWQGALAFCASLMLGGASGFRLPSIKELVSLGHGEGEDPTSAATSFLDEEGRFWSSTPVAAAPSEAWLLDGLTGRIDHQSVAVKARVRCVR